MFKTAGAVEVYNFDWQSKSDSLRMQTQILISLFFLNRMKDKVAIIYENGLILLYWSIFFIVSQHVAHCIIY